MQPQSSPTTADGCGGHAIEISSTMTATRAVEAGLKDADAVAGFSRGSVAKRHLDEALVAEIRSLVAARNHPSLLMHHGAVFRCL